jgi:hypothetical protein
MGIIRWNFKANHDGLRHLPLNRGNVKKTIRIGDKARGTTTVRAGFSSQ